MLVRQKMKQLKAIVFLFFTISAFAQDSQLGKKSPEISFDKILNFEKSKASLSDFKDKVVILDFWATWCVPCINSFPHLEELKSKFPNDLQIITITNDSEERIRRFLEHRAMQLPVVIDEKKEISKIFPHGVIPHTIVIDQSGVIKVVATPSQITEELIEKILSGQEVNIKEKSDVKNFDFSLPLSGNENFTYQITITPYNKDYASYSNTEGDESPYTGRRILATNLSARALYEIAYQFPSRTRTIVDVSTLSKFEWSEQNAICFELIVPEALGGQRFDIMKQQLSIYFGYQCFVEKRVRPVKVLQRIKGTELQINKTKNGTESTSSDTRYGLSMKSASIEQLAGFLESKINQPVVNETNLEGLYDIETPWYNESPRKIHEELKKIGLEMIDTEREIKVLVIKDK